MKHGIVFLTAACSLLFAAVAFGQTQDKQANQPAKKQYSLADVTRIKFTGDFDGMVKRRIIRILVTYSRTHYFVD